MWPDIPPDQRKETKMTKQAKRTLVHLGQARRQTQADLEKGVLEEIPVNMFRTPGWSN